MRREFWLSLLLLAYAPPALAQASGAMAGDYVCQYGCRLTDAAPSVAIDGETAICTNELGGIFRGRVLSDVSIACFNKVGALSRDGTTIHWSDGVIWKRHFPPVQARP